MMDSTDSESSCDSDIEELARLTSERMKSILSDAEETQNLSGCSDLDSESDESESDSSDEDENNKRNNVLNNKSLNSGSESLGFVIDTKASTDHSDDNIRLKQREVNETENRSEVKQERKKKLSNTRTELSSAIKSGFNFNDGYLSKSSSVQRKKDTKESIVDSLLKGSKKDQEIMKKSVMTADIEKKGALPPYEESLRQLKKQRKMEREKTKGKGWYGMPAPEMTDETKNDLEVLKMRKALDPKRFYKNNDMKGLPKYFQFGTVIETSADFYHSRIPKKQRKSNMVQELLADAEFRKYNKRKYVEIQEAKMKGLGPYDRMKKFKRKKKIH